MGSPIAAAIAPLTAEAKVPLVITNAAGVAIPWISPYLVRVSFTQWQTAVPLGKWAVEKGWKKGYTAVSDFIPGHDAENAFKKGFTDAGGRSDRLRPLPNQQSRFRPFRAEGKGREARRSLHLRAGRNPGHSYGKSDQGSSACARLKINVASTQDLLPDEELPNMGDAAVGMITAGELLLNRGAPGQYGLPPRRMGSGVRTQIGTGLFFAVDGWDGMAAWSST